MKTISIVIGVAALSLASGALAQTAPAPSAQDKVAAATLPNAFNAPQRAAAAPVAAAPAATTPPVPVPVAIDPRSEPALRAVIASVQSAGPLDVTLFSADAAAQMPEQEPQLRALLADKGELVTIVHRGQQNGADVYQALFENGDTQWMVGVDAAGKVAVFLFRETPVTPAT